MGDTLLRPFIQNNPNSVIEEKENNSDILKKNQSAEMFEGSFHTYSGISPDASSRSTSIQTGNSPIDDIAFSILPSYEEAYPTPSYAEALTTLPPLYTATQ